MQTHFSSRAFLLFVLGSLSLAPAVHAQAVASSPRIVTAVDDTNLVPLKGNTHPLANARNDRGRASSDLPMSDLMLVLSRSPEQQAAFDKFVAGQYDPHSPDYHHWLTPAAVGADFGPSLTDIQTLTHWLAGHGFTVGEVSPDRMTIRFGGSAGKVESAFHTEIHNLDISGQAHIANFGDPQIPAALASVLVGVKGLHNFFPKPLHRNGGLVKFDKKVGKWQRLGDQGAAPTAVSKQLGKSSPRPEFGVNLGSGNYEEDVAPYDFATIYNVLPSWSQGVDGTGQTIAIAGTSDIKLSDVTTFRSTFGLPAYTSSNQPKVVIVHGTDPTCTSASNSCDSDLTENTLDVEWSGAVARGAQIVLVVAGSTSATDDTLFDAEQYIVNNKTAPVMSVSYGLCELYNGTAENTTYNNLWQSAATEGIAVFVASGDAASAMCDDGASQQFGEPWASQYGLAVNGLASSQYDTAVGGTDFNWGTSPAPFWNTSNSSTGASAAGYVPEIPWNDTCTNPLVLSYIQQDATSVNWSGTAVTDAETACNFIAQDAISIFQNYTQNGQPVDLAFFVDTVGGGGGPSNCSTNTTTITGNNETIGTCTSGYAKPSWQTALTPADSARDLPDVSFFSANGFLGSAYLICVSLNGACVTSTSGATEPTAQEIGGTSVATPAMAGVMALINQAAGSSQGNPNNALYTLAGTQNYGDCSAETVVTASTSCYFNDIDTGTISMPCDYGAKNGGIVDTSGTPTLQTSDEQPGIKAPGCTPAHSGDTVGILAGVDAKAGYDLATGLGSLNVANVVTYFAANSTAPSFTVAGTALSINSGATTGNTTPVTVTPTNGFTGTVNLTCTVSAPSGSTSPVTCSVPASVTVSGAAAVAAALTVNSTSTTSGGAYSIIVIGAASGGQPSSSAAIAVTVTNPNATFTLTAGSASPATVAPGGTSVADITVGSTNGYNGSVVLTCTAASSNPTNATGDAPLCDVTLSGVAVGSMTPVTVLTIAAVTSELTTPRLGGPGKGRPGTWTGAAGGAALALLVLCGIPARRRKWLSMLGMIFALAALGGLAACGGGGGGGTHTTNPGTAAGTYVFTVSGTGSPSPSSAPAPVTFSVIVN